MASVLARVRSRPAILRTVAGLVVLTVLAIRFVAIAPDVMRLPREANRDAARVVLAREPQVPVLIYMRNPQNLEYYLERPAVELTPDEVVTRVCSGNEIVAYVTQPFGIPSVEVPCLSRAGTEHHRLEQYARGDEIDVWFVPPQSVQP